MASIAQYLVTLHFIDEFNFALADAYTAPEEQQNILWRAEVSGYQSVLGDLVKEAEEFEAKHIRVHENEDDGYHAALMDAMPGVIGIGESPEAARSNLRLAIEAALGLSPEDYNELPQTNS
jgi:predicted RNase H-like HicB family nuclease